MMLALLLLNTAHISFTLHTQESHTYEFAEILLEDAGHLDGRKWVVLLQVGNNHVYSGPLELQ